MSKIIISKANCSYCNNIEFNDFTEIYSKNLGILNKIVSIKILGKLKIVSIFLKHIFLGAIFPCPLNILNPHPPSSPQNLLMTTETSIIFFSYGTFGFWTSFLSHGDVIFATGYGNRDLRIMQNLNLSFPNWIPLNVLD